VGKLLEKDIEYLDDSYSNYYSSEIEIKNIKQGKYIIFCHLDLDELNEKINTSSSNINKVLSNSYNTNNDKVFLNKKIGILKIYSNQEFLILDRLTIKDLDFHLAFDYLIHSLYLKKFSNLEKSKKYLIENENLIFYSNFRINKYSKFIVYVFKNAKPKTQFLLEFQIINSATICLSNFNEFNEVENKFVKLIPFDNTFLCTLYGSTFRFSHRHKLFYCEEELKKKCKTEGTCKTLNNDVVYFTLLKDGVVCFNFVNKGLNNYVLKLDVTNFQDFEFNGEQRKSYEVYLLANSDEYLILEFKNRMSFDRNVNSINYAMSLQKI